MSESEEESEVSYFGTPLEPYDEDAFPKKRPITVEEQVAKDAQGRRRFHGAFTGGFSAGFYNTVGSLEGWAPQEFKSSRAEKAQNKRQKPEDFMDDEDLGEFGIAPQTVRATDDYSSSKKRKRKAFSDGPIPGEPVLETLLQAGNETVGYFLMKNMNQKHRANERSGPKVYGCMMPRDLPTEDDYDDLKQHLHEVYKQHLSAPKSNTFGIAYVGLDKTHLSLFQPTNLTVRERNNKKLSISGQAFGVGAFEDEDDDIYVKDDMSKYDFELTTEASRKDKKGPVPQEESLVFGLFVASKQPLTARDSFPAPVIPSSFTGKHNVKKSRFEPVAGEAAVPERKSINASMRAKYLGEDHGEKTYTPSNRQHKQQPDLELNKKSSLGSTKEVNDDIKPKSSDQALLSSGLLFDRFVSAKQDDDPTNLLEPVKPTEMDHGTEEMHAAVKMKMFGPLTRVTIAWMPNSLLCKRFNVPEPHSGDMNAQKNKRRTKNLIFEYQKHAEKQPDHTPGLSIQQTSSASEITTNEAIIENASPLVTNQDQNLQESSVSINIEGAPEASSSKSQEVTEEPKNINEKVLDITERVDVSKNIDLFKAVFLSSSESESEDEAVGEDEDKKRKEEITANVLSEPLVPKIKSTKEGILSNIDFSKFQSKAESRPDEEKEVESKAERVVDDNIYGPKLPAKAPLINPVTVSEAVNDGEWVEKDFVAKVKKHKKKHKKEKDRDKSKKKHKHKSKR